MELEFNEEFVKENNFTPEHITAVKGYLETNYIPELKKGWDSLANENAEGILTGAAKYAKEKAGVDLDREKGEKWGDYFVRLSDKGLESTKSAFEKKQAELDEKLKNFKGGDEYKSQVEKLASEKDALLQKLAKLEPLEGLDEKYKEATGQLSNLKKEVAYNAVKPNFPDTVNPYEARAKWDEFKKGVEEKYNLEMVDGEPVAVDKENVHKQVKLSALVSGNESLKSLLAGRQQGGTGAEPAEEVEVDGLPFKVNKNATTEELSAKINEHLVKKLGSRTHDSYAGEFQKLFALAKKAA